MQIAVLWGHAGCLLSRVERCLLLGGSRCSYYFYRESNWGHGICPLYRDCPPFGKSVIRGFIVYIYYINHCTISIHGTHIR